MRLNGASLRVRAVLLLAAAAPLRTSAILAVRARERTKEYISTENLYRWSALVRAEVHKVCQVPVPVEDAMAAAE
jgi:hypothetical protein